MTLYHVAITGRDRRHLTELGARHRILVVGYREDRKQGAQVDAYVPPGKMEWLKKRGYGVTRLEEVTKKARQRQAEERTAAAGRLKRGRYGDVIWAGGYLTADEIERAIALGPERHQGYVERIPLPHRTWEKRRVHALRIGKGRGRRRPGICFIGGVHGREWGSADILIYFADPALASLSRPHRHPRRQQALHGETDQGDRREEGRVPGASGESRRPPLQHGAAADVA